MTVTPEMIESLISNEGYVTVREMFPTMPNSTATLCVLELENGFSIDGASHAVNAADFDPELGRKYAREDAIRKFYRVLAYQLKNQGK